MKYMGSKARIAKDISQIINQRIKDNGIDIYIEPFVGGANMIQHINCPVRIGYDNNPYLIAFLNAIKCGWNPLTEVQMTKQLYQDIRSNPDKYPPTSQRLPDFAPVITPSGSAVMPGQLKPKSIHIATIMTKPSETS